MIIGTLTPYGSQSLVTGAASTSVALTKGSTVRVFNAGTFPVFVRLGGTAAAAVAGDLAIPPNGVEFLSAAPDKFAQDGTNFDAAGTGPTFIAAISPGGAGAISITTGT